MVINKSIIVIVAIADDSPLRSIELYKRNRKRIIEERSIIFKLGLSGLGGDRHGGVDEVLRLEHRLVPDLNELQPAGDRMVTCMIHDHFRALHCYRRSGGDLCREIHCPFQCRFRCREDPCDEAELLKND